VGFDGTTGGLARVSGVVSVRGGPAAWSLVLKACRDPGGTGPVAVQHHEYWRREFLAYASGVLDALPPGVEAPRCFGADERPGGAWLWLEDLGDAPGGAPWPLDRYGSVARHAGQFNGAYLAGRPLPAVPWLSAGVARSYVERWGRHVERLGEFVDHPLVRRQWPDATTRDRITRLWRERETFLAALARLPQVLAHLDLFKPNLFLADDPSGRVRTVAVDWAYLGTAAVGEELAPLVCASVAFGGDHAERVPELGELAFASYVAGLRDAGWGGDERTARLGYCAGVIRYGVNAWALVALREPELAARAERVWGPFGEQVVRFGAVQRYTLALADEARALLA
jgi:hypothetical protein